MFDRQLGILNNIENVINESFQIAIDDNALLLEDAIINKQLYDKGVDGDGKRLRGYTRSTIRYKLRKGQPADRTTLRDKYKFHPSIKVRAFAREYQVSSNVFYDVYLTKKYGKHIYKVSGQNMKAIIQDKLRETIKKKLKDE